MNEHGIPDIRIDKSKVKSISRFGVVWDFVIVLNDGRVIELSKDTVQTLVSEWLVHVSDAWG